MVPHFVHTMRGPNRGICMSLGQLIGVDVRLVPALVALDRERPDAILAHVGKRRLKGS
jgi:hypothetical protein